jgi:hypothetical protein
MTMSDFTNSLYKFAIQIGCSKRCKSFCANAGEDLRPEQH